jgi:ribosomal protein L37AE/L43A
MSDYVHPGRCLKCGSGNVVHLENGLWECTECFAYGQAETKEEWEAVMKGERERNEPSN